MASQNSLEISDASGHTDPLESEDDTTQEWWLDPQNVLQGEHLHPIRKTDIYRRLKCRLGAHSGQNSTGGLWSLSEKHLHINLLEMKAVLLALQDRLQEQSSPYRLRQYLSGGLYQQTGRHKISRTLCSNMENPHLVSPKQWHTQSKACTGLSQCDSGRPLKEEPDSINRVVSVSTDFQTNFQTLGESPSGPVRNQPEQNLPTYVSPIPDPQAWAVDALNIPWENMVAYAFPPTTLLPKVVQKIQSQTYRIIPIVPIVLGPGGDVSGHSKTTTTHTHSAKTTTEQPIPCQPNIPEPPCLVSRSSELQEHGFTAEVAERIAAPQRLSTRSINTSKWTVFQRWCRKTGGLQGSRYRRHLQLLLVSVQ